MIDLYVFRGAGDRDGDEIFDPLLCDIAPALQRGKYEIDFNTPKIQQTMEVGYASAVRAGDQVSVSDSRTGEVIYGVLRDYSHVLDGPTVYTRISIEVPQ